MMLDLNAKYAIIKQTKGTYPISVTFYSNFSYDTRKNGDAVIYDGSPTKHKTDRMFFFNQLIIAKKLTNKLSVQLAPSITHQNAVSGYYTKNDSTGKEIYNSMKHDHIAISLAARYKLTPVTSLIMNYDQPLTKHPSMNPNPNLSLGVEFNTDSHSFQIFFGNFYNINPAKNNLFNRNSPVNYTDNLTNQKVKNRYLIGFNITHLWVY
jgi:hypothetical protein